MSEAGWGIWAGLPPAARRQLVQEEAREALDAKRAAEEREIAAEAWRDRNLTLYRQQAEARGEEIGFLAVATGQVTGRPIAAVFAEHLRASDATDARDAARASREGDGRIHIEVGEPILHYGRGETGWAIFHRARRFRARVQARKALDEAEAASGADFPLQGPVTR